MIKNLWEIEVGYGKYRYIKETLLIMSNSFFIREVGIGFPFCSEKINILYRAAFYVVYGFKGKLFLEEWEAPLFYIIILPLKFRYIVKLGHEFLIFFLLGIPTRNLNEDISVVLKDIAMKILNAINYYYTNVVGVL